MIVASNRTPQDWYGLFPNPVLAEGALDRLVNSVHHVLMPGRSYRPLCRPDRRTTHVNPEAPPGELFGASLAESLNVCQTEHMMRRHPDYWTSLLAPLPHRLEDPQRV